MHTKDMPVDAQRATREGRSRSYHAGLGVGIDGLTVREHEPSRPGPGEVTLELRARSLSSRDLMIPRGWYPLPIKPDVVPISDGAGEVVEVGEGVRRVTVGDRVSAATFPRWTDGRFTPEVTPQLGGSLDGMLAERVSLAENGPVPLPPAPPLEHA